jgi:hypothetical protein
MPSSVKATTVLSFASSVELSENTNRRRCIVQNLRLIWLDEHIDELNDDFHKSFTQLRQIINTIDTFLDADHCIDFLTQAEEDKVY